MIPRVQEARAVVFSPIHHQRFAVSAGLPLCGSRGGIAVKKIRPLHCDLRLTRMAMPRISAACLA
jgi:nitrite reductase/ring-hydroxylating ferredoxin subunit